MEAIKDFIQLNVGGEKFTTTRSTLCQVEGSLLAAMLVMVMVMVLITYYNSYIQLNYHMFTSNIGTITTVLNLNIYLHCQIGFYIY